MIKLEPQQKIDLFNIAKDSAPKMGWWECELRTAIRKICPLLVRPNLSDVINGYLISCGFSLDEMYELKEVPDEHQMNRISLVRDIKYMVYHANCETEEEFIELFNQEVLPLIRKLK